MEGHFTLLSPFIPDQNWQKLVAAVLLAGALYVIGKACTARLSSAEGRQKRIIPEKKITLFGLFDFVVETFVKFHDSVTGKENRRHIPFTASVFLFVLIANLLGLIPGVPAITTTVWVNVGMALVVFVYFNYFGIREHGLIGYLKHFAGPPGLPLLMALFIAPLLFPLEILSTTLRILTLNLRLYWNITADHMVLGIFTELLHRAPGAAAALYILAAFVSFMQAFIFTMLTMLYILLATQHGEEHA